MPFPRSKKIYDEAALYDYAVGALGRRMRTVAELKRLMRQKIIAGEREAVIDAVVQKLKDQRYLNDSQYAAMYSSLRKESGKLGRQRVSMDLKAKGVHGEVIEKALDSTYEGVNEEQLAREFIERKRLKKPSVGRRSDAASMKQAEKETARIFRALARAGFRTGAIIRVLKQWDAPDEVLTALSEEDGPHSPGRAEDL